MPGIAEAVKDIQEKCNQILQWQAAHTETHKSIDTDLANFRDTLYDKEFGMVYKIRQLCNGARDIKEKAKGFKHYLLTGLVNFSTSALFVFILWLLLLYKKN